MHGLDNMNFYSPKPNAQSPTAQSNTECLVRCCSLGSSACDQPLGGRSITLGHMDALAFYFHWNRHFRYRFAFSIHRASAKTAIRGLTECVIHCFDIHTALLMINIHFTASEVPQWPHAYGMHRS